MTEQSNSYQKHGLPKCKSTNYSFSNKYFGDKSIKILIISTLNKLRAFRHACFIRSQYNNEAINNKYYFLSYFPVVPLPVWHHTLLIISCVQI